MAGKSLLVFVFTRIYNIIINHIEMYKVRYIYDMGVYGCFAHSMWCVHKYLKRFTIIRVFFLICLYCTYNDDKNNNSHSGKHGEKHSYILAGIVEPFIIIIIIWLCTP